MSSVPVRGNQTDSTSAAPKYKWGFSERFRMVNWDNAISLDRSADAGTAFTRHRSSIWGQWFPDRAWEFTVKLTNEYRYYFVPTTRDFTFNEIVFDWLYARWNAGKFLPATLTVGRQNIVLGEGFVVLEAHPFDGSRAISFNALRLDVDLSPRHKATLFYTYQPRIDNVLPIINDQEMELVEQPEEGFGIYYQGLVEEVDLQAYYIRKNTLNYDYYIQDPYAQAAHPVKTVRPSSQINTIGLRFQRAILPKLSGTIEAAHQFGKRGVIESIPDSTIYRFAVVRNVRSAYGGYLHLDYTTGWPKYAPATLTGGLIYLSGDDPKTDTFEGWDPVFGRWPKWSESYIYTEIKEDGVAWWTDLSSTFVKAQFDFTPQLNFRVDYYHLMAPFARPDEFPGGAGHHRGELIIGKLNFKIDKRLGGHVLWEGFWPGNFYFDGADGYSWTRIEFFYSL